MANSSFGKRIEDLGSFLAAAEILTNRRASLREVAGEIGIPSTSLQNVISRLENQYGEPLVERTGKRAATGLTLAGVRLVARLAGLFEPLAQQEKLRITVSKFLSRTIGLSVAIEEFQQSNPRVELELRAIERLPTEETFQRILRSQTDAVFLWQTDARLKLIDGNPPLNGRVVGSDYEAVVVSHSRPLVELVNRLSPNSLNDLGKYRWVTLSDENQIAQELLPMTHLIQGKRVIVDSYEAAVREVRLRAADYALIPAVYEELQQDVQLGQIYPSKPVGKAKVMLVTKASQKSQLTVEFENLLSEWLGSRELFTGSSKGFEEILITDPSFLERIQFGYYIADDDDFPLTWCTELVLEPTLPVKVDARLPGNSTLFASVIRNQFGVEYSVNDAQIYGRVFYFHAKRDRSLKSDMAGAQFVAVFNWCDESRGVLCGTWCGHDKQGKAGVFGIVLSQKQLSFHDLRRLSLLYRPRTILFADGMREDKLDIVT